MARRKKKRSKKLLMMCSRGLRTIKLSWPQVMLLQETLKHFLRKPKIQKRRLLRSQLKRSKRSKQPLLLKTQPLKLMIKLLSLIQILKFKQINLSLKLLRNLKLRITSLKLGRCPEVLSFRFKTMSVKTKKMNIKRIFLQLWWPVLPTQESW